MGSGLPFADATLHFIDLVMADDEHAPLPTTGVLGTEDDSSSPLSPLSDDAPPSGETAPTVVQPPLDKPPLDPRVLRNVIVSYEGETVRVPQCDTPVFHGQGVAVFRTGFTYSGVFHFGRMHGLGRIEWDSGVVYEGAFVDGEMLGRGSYTWPNGSSYEGDVVRGRRHGHGIFHSGTRGVVTVGGQHEMQLDAPESSAGEGLLPLRFSFPSGRDGSEPLEATSNARYEGEWVEGLPHGRGVLVFDDEQHARYEGDFVEGKRHGHGEMRYASGNVYVGQWENDVKCGHGTMLWMAAGGSSAVEKYDGAWRDDRPHGHGRHVWLGAARQQPQREKNWYEGQFANGVRHGLGAFFYANGARYEGEWVENVKHGTGVFFYEDGRVFVGDFRDDRAMDAASPTSNSSDTQATSGKVLLFVDDLLPSEARDKARKLIEHAVLRLNTELRALYRQYIALPAPGSPTKQSTSPVRVTTDSTTETAAVLMEYYECRRLLADCGVRVSAGHLERHLRRVRDAQRESAIPANTSLPDVQLTDAVTLATSLPEVVPPERLLLFREFVELLVRLAHEQQQQQQQDTDEEAANKSPHALANAFTALYEQLTRERQQQAAHGATGQGATTSPDAWAMALQQLHAKELHHVYQKHHHALQRLFLACDQRTHDPRKTVEAEPEQDEEEDAQQVTPHSGPDTVSVRSLVAQLQDLHAFSPSFRMRHALLALQEAFSLEDDSEPYAADGKAIDPFFVETPLLFTDFLDAIAIVLLSKQYQQETSTGVPLCALVDDFVHALPAQL